MLQNIIRDQAKYRASPNYLRAVQQGFISVQMRRDIVEWLYRLSRHFTYHSETFAMATNYVDRFLSRVCLPPCHLQLLAMTCLALSAKLQEVWNTQPSAQLLAMAARGAFSTADVSRMERVVLVQLDWLLNCVTPHIVSHQVAECLAPPGATCSERRRGAAQLATAVEPYLDAACCSYSMLCYTPATQACAAIVHVLRRSSRSADAGAIRVRCGVVCALAQVDPYSDSFQSCYQQMALLAPVSKCAPTSVIATTSGPSVDLAIH